MFVKFECGCIGLPPDKSTGRALLIDTCDDGLTGFLWRDMAGKSHAPLPDKEQMDFINEINTLIADGYDFRTIHRIVTRAK